MRSNFATSFTLKLLTIYRAEKERFKAEKLAKQQMASTKSDSGLDAILDDVVYLSIDEQDTYESMGDMARMMSRSSTGRNFIQISNLENTSESEYGTNVWICGRINSIRIKGGSCFLVIRQDSFHTIQ